jgi:hypothetical protein
MADHGIAREMNAQTAIADAAFRMIIELDCVQIGNEIDNPVFMFSRLQFAAEKIFLPGKAISELMSHVKNEFRGVIQIHH